MTTIDQKLVELFDQRAALLTALAGEIKSASNDIVALDIDGLEQRIAAQESICGQLRTLDHQIGQLHEAYVARVSVSSARLSPGTQRTNAALRATMARLQNAQSTVKLLNDSHHALLLRSRRTVTALLRSYHSLAMTYSNPAEPVVSSVEGS